MKKRRTFSAEFKIKCIKELLEGNIALKAIARREGIDHHVISIWREKYLEYGESYFYEEHRGKKGGNHFSALHTKKNLSNEERLELENLKLRIENERLKKGYLVKGVGVDKEFVTTKDVNLKS